MHMSHVTTSSSREHPRHRRAPRLPSTIPGVYAHCTLLLASAVVVLQLSSSPALAQGVSERRIDPQQVKRQSEGGVGARGASPLLPRDALGAGRGSIARAARGDQNSEDPVAPVTSPTTTSGVRRPEASRQITSQLLTSTPRVVGSTSRGAKERAAFASRNLIYAPRNNTPGAESGVNDSTTVDSDTSYDDDDATTTDDNTVNTNTTDDTNSTATAVSGGAMMVSGNIIISSGGITTTVSGVDMTLTVEQMTVDDDVDTVGVMDPSPEDANDDGDFTTVDNNNDTTLTNSTDNSSGTTSDGDAAFETVDSSTNTTDANNSDVPDATLDDSDSSDTTPEDSSSSEAVVMCGDGNSRRALDDRTLEALDAVQKSSGARITVTVKSGECACKVAGTDAQVEAALRKVRRILA